MNVAPTWDLLITILSVVIVAYSVIIGTNSTVKVILSTYVGILCADGLGNVLYYLGNNSGSRMTSFLFNGPDAAVLIKVIIMVTIIVAMMLKGSFSVDLGETGGLLDILLLLLMGVLSAGLIVTSILVFVSGGAFLTSGAIGATDLAVDIYNTSELAQLMISNASFIIALPGLAFMIMSWFTE
ncbi:MAG: hypothetical protein PHU71_01170 [Candidatus Gracilibacteria bacterium]|nr:hypothetical protein [Candidatus Gracilibacteria bacterium]